jgi:hypothetical protein
VGQRQKRHTEHRCLRADDHVISTGRCTDPERHEVTERLTYRAPSRADLARSLRPPRRRSVASFVAWLMGADHAEPILRRMAVGPDILYALDRAVSAM